MLCYVTVMYFTITGMQEHTVIVYLLLDLQSLIDDIDCHRTTGGAHFSKAFCYGFY